MAPELRVPQKIQDLETRIREFREKIRSTIWLFREVFESYAAAWIDRTAKAVAVGHHEHTLKLGQVKIKALKAALQDHKATLADRILKEFDIEQYAEAKGVSSGQVHAIISRRFEEGIRRILATIGKVLHDYGYVRDEHLADPDAAIAARVAFPVILDLPPDLQELIQRVSDSITDIKVAESKILYFERQREKEVASDLWDQC